MRRAWRLPVFLIGAILVLQTFPYPALRDAATEQAVSGFWLTAPPLRWLFLPLFGLADWFALNSLTQWLIWLAYVAGIAFAWLKPVRALMALGAFLAFAGFALLAPRPTVRLTLPGPDWLAVDFHSHTALSHDGRPGFGAAANAAWHARHGFQAAFITDHNQWDAAWEGKDLSRQAPPHWPQGYRSLAGEEVSLFRTHLVVLGNRARIDNQPYDSDPAKVYSFITECRRQGLPVLASLPEYWRHHGRSGALRMIQAGVSGFEIVNASPKALEFPLRERREIIRLSRQHDLALVAVTDMHGYGHAVAGWTVLRIPGWRDLDVDGLEKAVLARVQEGYDGTRVLEKARFWPLHGSQAALGPPVQLFLYFRSLSPWEAVVWTFWILAIVVVRARLRPLARKTAAP